MIVIETSPNAGYFRIDGVDYGKNQYVIKYDNKNTIESLRNFSLCSIDDGTKIIASRGYAEINSVNSWGELLALLSNVGALFAGGADGSTIPVTPYTLAINMGKLPAHSFVDKFGAIKNMDVADAPVDVWENITPYTYDANGTAPIVSIASDGADTVDINVQGLDITGEEVSQTITLNGTTRVPLTTPLWRVYRASNQGATPLVGTVFIYTGTGSAPSIGDSNVRALIVNGDNQTLMTIYTIPKGKVGFLHRGEIGTSRNKDGDAECSYYSRRYGKVFRVKKRLAVVNNGSSNYQDARSAPDIIPSLTDLKITVEIISKDDMGVWATFDIELINETEFTTEYLQAIGQPGY